MSVSIIISVHALQNSWWWSLNGEVCGYSHIYSLNVFGYSLDTVSFPTDVFSASRNDKGHIKPAPDGFLTLRPPIKECTVPESTTSEVSKMGRLLCTAEEVCRVWKVSLEMKQLSSSTKLSVRCGVAVCNSGVGGVNEAERLLLENQHIAFYLPSCASRLGTEQYFVAKRLNFLNHFHGNSVRGW